ncbi:metal ABC transporter permease [Clostridium sp.]|uniref:metal ABC transporter permease n=1 Tax=Clostridium sp. TaxID=1506 RepID=UPI003216B76C
MFQYEFMQNAFLAAIFISILCPIVGVFLVLKRHSMMGDTLAHSAFAGVAIGLVFGFNPIICAFIFTTVCGLSIEYLRNYYKKYAELILSIVLTFSVGVGITLISTGKASGSVNSYLFGSILTVTKFDLVVMVLLSCISIIVLYVLYDKLLYITFDEEGAKIAGINVKAVNYIFALLVGATISVSIRIMGILVMSSMIALPVATALQLNKGFKPTLLLSILFGFVDIILGLILSYILNCAPGGTIALTSVFILVAVIIYNTAFKCRKG